MIKLRLIFTILLFAQTIFGQTYPNIKTILDSCKTDFSKQINSPNKNFLSSFVNNVTYTKGNIGLDSIKCYYPIDQFTYSLFMGILYYDNQGRFDNIIWYDIDTVGSRSIFEKIEYSYTQSNKPLSNYLYSGIADTWIKVGGNEYYYDTNDIIIQKKSYTYSNGYKIESDINYVFNSLGLLTQKREEYWKYYTPPSHNYYKTEHTYNQNNLLTNDTVFQMLDGNWFAIDAEIRTYNSLNQLEFAIPSMRLYDSSWYQWNKFEFSINQANLIDTIIKFRKNSSGNWYLAQKFFYSYTASGDLSNYASVNVTNGGLDLPFEKQDLLYTTLDSLYKITDYKYDTVTQSWKINKIWENIFDSSGNVLFDYNCYWSFYTGLWDSIVNERSIYNYTINTNSSNFPIVEKPNRAITDYINPNSSNLLMERTQYKKELLDDTVVLSGHFTFYYSGIPMNYSQISKESSFSLYPNPASTQVTIKFSDNYKDIGQLKLYDINGKLINSYNINNRQSLSVEGLSKGIYIYTITINNKLHSGKLCVY